MTALRACLVDVDWIRGKRMEFEKYGKIRGLGHAETQEIFFDGEHDIHVQEKIDGANFRVMIKNGVPIFGSRNNDITENTPKNFKRCIQYLYDKLMSCPSTLEKLEGCIIYGECCVKHTLSYDWDEIPPFIGFDVMKPDGNWLHPNAVKEVFKALEIEYTPTTVHKAKDVAGWKFDDSVVPVAKYAPKTNPQMKAEGIVMKNYHTGSFAKYVRDDFKEENAKTFGGSPKYGESDTAKLGLRYITNARIEKIIFKKVDMDEPLEMQMMRTLVRDVVDDVFEEHWKDIYNSKMTVDFRFFNKIASKRCSAVLKQVIVNNALAREKDE